MSCVAADLMSRVGPAASMSVRPASPSDTTVNFVIRRGHRRARRTRGLVLVNTRTFAGVATGAAAPGNRASPAGRAAAWISYLAATLLTACGNERPEKAEARNPAPPTAATPNGARATATLEAEDGQWSRPAKDYASLRYSQRGQITAANAASLRPAWTFSTGVLRGHEEAPIVVGNTMYVMITPFPNLVYALD